MVYNLILYERTPNGDYYTLILHLRTRPILRKQFRILLFSKVFTLLSIF
jgi:hypothetical protein